MCEDLLEVVCAQGTAAVVRDQVVEVVEEDVVDEIVLRLSPILSRPNTAVVHAVLTPASTTTLKSTWLSNNNNNNIFYLI